jgi:hypothetical protein
LEILKNSDFMKFLSSSYAGKSSIPWDFIHRPNFQNCSSDYYLAEIILST